MQESVAATGKVKTQARSINFIVLKFNLDLP